MSVLPLRYVPDVILKTKAKKVRAIDDSIQRLINDLIDSMHEASGVGLAANQVGSLYRVAVVQLPDDEMPTVLVNPKVVRREGEREVEEGCLSIPGYRGMVKRAERLRVKAQGRDGKPFSIKADELRAQALEHEIDHLDGILYIDRLESSDKLFLIETEEEVAPATG